MIINDDLKTILQTAKDLSVVCEIYPDGTAPPFDPADTIARFAAVNGIIFEGQSYIRLVDKYGNIKRTTTQEVNSASVDFSNLTREIAEFEFVHGFEGLIKVLRLISRSGSDSLAKSLILFTGRCEKIDSGTKQALTVKSKYVVGATDNELPRRKFTTEDAEGRTPQDPEFEGFIFTPQYGITTYSVRERRGGLWGLIGLKKNVTKQLQYSSYSDLDSERVVPLAFGRVQMEGMHLGAQDTGGWIRILTAFCEGEVFDFINIRSTNPQLPLNPLAQAELYGKVGVLNGPPDNAWVAPGLYSKTAHIRCEASNSQVDVIEAAPGVVAVVIALIMTIPDSGGTWTASGWSDNPAAATFFALTSPDYHNLDPAWIHGESFFAAFKYNDEILFDTSSSDFLFVPTGFSESLAAGSSNYLIPTSSVTARYLKYLNGETTALETFGETTAKSIEYDPESLIPIEPPDPETPVPPGGGITLDLLFYLRRRYTYNATVTEQQKIIDFLHNSVFTASRMFLSQAEDGRVKLNHKKPADFGLSTASFADGETAIALDDISKWIDNKTGKVLVDAYTNVSEVHTVTGANYSTAQNSVTLSASANIIVTEFSGCDGGTNPANAVLTVESVEEENSFTLDGIETAFGTVEDDTVATMAGFIYASINAHPILKRKYSAAWIPGDRFVTITAKFGSLILDTPLLYDHSAPIANPTAAPTLTAASGGNLEAGVFRVAYSYTNQRGQTLLSPFASVTVTANQKINVSSVSIPAGATGLNWFCVPAANSAKLRRFKTQTTAGGFSIDLADLPLLNDPLPTDISRTGAECMRVAMVFSDRCEPRTGLIRSNVIKSSYKWMLGNQTNSVNQVEGTFRDATKDFKLTKIIVKDKAHQKKTKKLSKKEINLSGIDNYNQAYRIAAGTLAELRDADFFYQHASDRESLLLEEGDVICVTDDGARLINFPVRIETIEFSDLNEGFVEAKFTSRKYISTLYDDSVAERQIPFAIETGSFADYLANKEEFTVSTSTPTRIFNASTATLQQTKDTLATFIDDYQNKRL